ncbi:MAG: methyltransferase domain-containing protein [Armatimonadetes bacterium]|nr:methyltransferase domain-containing protein [Armatimonadota bacterium]
MDRVVDRHLDYRDPGLHPVSRVRSRPREGAHHLLHLQPQATDDGRGDVHNLKFSDDTFSLVVSRCSLLCWNDKVKAFSEMYRVLRPRGIGFVGMGSGKYLSRSERKRVLSALDELRERGHADKEWLKDLPSTDYLCYIVMKAGVTDYRILRYPDGVWVEMRKSLPQADIRRRRSQHACPNAVPRSSPPGGGSG